MSQTHTKHQLASHMVAHMQRATAAGRHDFSPFSPCKVTRQDLPVPHVLACTTGLVWPLSSAATLVWLSATTMMVVPPQVRRAYKGLVTRAHPDKGGDPVRFKAIQKAYEVLGDPGKVRVGEGPGCGAGTGPGQHTAWHAKSTMVAASCCMLSTAW